MRIDLIAAAVLLGFFLTVRLQTATVLLLAVLLHEGGHLLAAKWLRIRVSEIRLGLLGARMEVRQILSYRQEWLLAAAGPAAGFLGALFALPFWRFGFWQTFCVVSFGLSLLNLLPVQTFDGGRMLACHLAQTWGQAIAGIILRRLSFCVLFLLWCFSVYLLLRAGSGLSWLGFSVSLLLGFFEEKTPALPAISPAFAKEKQRKTEKSKEKAKEL